jgi:hypothetical protein
MEKQIEEIENQIAEIAKLITEGARSAMEDAEALYNAGYRKASSVAEEIFAEIDKIVDSFKIEEFSKETNEHIRTSYNGSLIVMCLAELKKKYTKTEGGE